MSDTNQTQEVLRQSKGLEGSILKEKFEVGRFLDCGQFGNIHKVVNKENPKEHLALKVCEYSDAFANEISVQKKVWKSSQENENVKKMMEENKVAFP